MSVHLTKHGTFEVKWREGGIQKSKSFRDEKAAIDYDRFQRDRRAEGRLVLRRKDVPTLREFATEWLAAKTRLSASTERDYSQLLASHVLPELGHLSLLDLRPRRLGQWQSDRLAAGAGPSSIGKAGMLLAQILDRAVAYEYLDTNPARVLERPGYTKRPHRWATPEDVETIRGWFLEREDLGGATLISVLGYVGIRPQDALALGWSQQRGNTLRVDRKVMDGEVVPGSKTGEGYKRVVEVPGPVLADLAEWRMAQGRPEGLLFPRPSDGMPWRKTDWRNWTVRRFQPAAGAAGLLNWDKNRKRWTGDFTPYSLRHTAASLMIAAHRRPTEVAEQLGHSLAVSVSTYQHYIDEARDMPVRSVEEWIRDARGELAQRREATG